MIIDSIYMLVSLLRMTVELSCLIDLTWLHLAQFVACFYPFKILSKKAILLTNKWSTYFFQLASFKSHLVHIENNFPRKLNLLGNKFLYELPRKYKKLFDQYLGSSISQEIIFCIMFGSTINFLESNIKMTKITLIINYVILICYY